ncbi:MAG: DUF1059 domain-containing protein [bacterium]
MKTLSCRDVGVDCDFVARGRTEEEIFRKCEEHARKDHNMQGIPDDLRTKMRGFIREESR